ncbi:MAG: TraR/DksA C4-type zinc finger protein [Firmicutes bacterium]|nr:TraR/DksA C4-type zinc finger protein [Bacillota bacterium]
MLTEGQLAHYKRKLFQEQKRISDELAELRAPQSVDSLKDSVGELSAYDNHSSDLATETFEREKDIGLADNLKIIQSQIDEALERIEDGTYGRCAICGREISEERLEAVPYATTCLEHADDEFNRTTEQRPAEEENLYAPFDRTFTDGAENENIGFDGEDTWQAVARYGTANSPQDIPDAIDYDEVYVDADEDRGIVQLTDAIIDVTEGEQDQDHLIFPEPDRNRERRPHKKRLREK